jgi:hypothetical protein
MKLKHVTIEELAEFLKWVDEHPSQAHFLGPRMAFELRDILKGRSSGGGGASLLEDESASPVPPEAELPFHE